MTDDGTTEIATRSALINPASWTEFLELDKAFPAQQPLELDIGCGKGRFLLGAAAANPGINYLGIDRMLKRLRRVDSKIVKRGLINARLLRVEAAYAIQYLVPSGSVSAAYIFFPDPWPKRKHNKHRLFTAAFLDNMHRVLLPAARMHVATDDEPYFTVIHGILRNDRRYAECEPWVPPLDLCTDFELKFRSAGLAIQRCSFERK